MTVFYGKDFGINPGKDVTQELIALFKELSVTNGEKTVFLEKGKYYINSDKCNEYMLYITNTVGDDEFSKEEIPHLQGVAFYLENIEDLTFDGGDSIFVIDGKVTNMAISSCKNVTVKNLEICHSHPDMHELKVIDKGLFFVDFEIDRDSLCEFRKGKLYFYGRNYRVRADENAEHSCWIGLIRKETPNRIKRVLHPLAYKFKMRIIDERKIRVYYPNTKRFKVGDCYYPYDVRRQFSGIFLQKSENITIEHIAQRFNYSLAYVAQDCENLTIKNADFSPEKDGARKMASVADFIQLSMCRGKVAVSDCNFDGAGDDCLNIHGIHLSITAKEENKLTLTFMHPQTHGFNPLRKGDTLSCVDTQTLLEKGRGKILDSFLKDENNIIVALENTDTFGIGDVVEDIDACPDLTFINNQMTRIITRGLLITTRGKVIIENNLFESTTMSGILISDDAKSWYESGMCTDITIKGNIFLYCGNIPILIKPENSIHKGAVHKNIKIIGNTFKNYVDKCIFAKSTDDIVIENNTFLNDNFLYTENCDNIFIGNNTNI